MYPSKVIIPIASFVLAISAFSVLFFYKQHVENKTTHILTGCKENPILQDYY
jgi:hypothetical protein